MTGDWAGSMVALLSFDQSEKHCAKLQPLCHTPVLYSTDTVALFGKTATRNAK
jgi:hypothetical protein